MSDTHPDTTIWMQTFTGRRYYPLDPAPDQIDIIDIAQSLGATTRYGGHCVFYSVAEHCVLVSRLVPEEHALAGLFHDATEAYLHDVVRPVKNCMRRDNEYFYMEELSHRAIAAKFGLPHPLPPEVKEADNRMLILEHRVLHPRAEAWDLPFAPPPAWMRIRRFAPLSASLSFLARYAQLAGVEFDPLAGELVRLNMELGK